MKKRQTRNSVCTICGETDQSKFYSRNKQWHWRQKFCKECEKKRKRQYNWKFRNIDVEEASKLWETIKVCEICERDVPLHLDHDHSTGKIRGMLCGNCNRALGLFKDSKPALLKAVDYLDKT